MSAIRYLGFRDFLRKRTNPAIKKSRYLRDIFFAIFFFAGFGAVILAAFFLMVFMQLAQTFRFFPSTFRACKFMYCLFKVRMFEWDRLASRVVPRPQMSHVLAILRITHNA
jgi:hypothetical protein